jgi:alpha-galactosidase
VRRLWSLAVCVGVLAACTSPTPQPPARPLAPPMGWNSWNSGITLTERAVEETIDAMVSSGMRDAGYRYVNLDAGWAAPTRDADGNLRADPERFPHGIPALARYAHDRGMYLGLYDSPFNQGCGQDPRTGAAGHERADARAFADWGVDYLKYDWCHHGTADAQETYKTMRDGLRAAGRPVVFSICEWGNNKPWLWGKDVGHLWRTTGDITDCHDCQAVYSLGWKHILEGQVGLEQYAGPDHWNDPDMLEVGNPGLTLAESRAHFSLWSILAAPLMAGNDVRKMSKEIREILTDREVIAIDQDPLGKQGYRYMDHPGKQIWVKELTGGAWAVCFFNTSDAPLPLRIDWNHLSFLKGAFRVRDIWQKKELGTTGHSEFRATVGPHDVILLKMSPAR